MPSQSAVPTWPTTLTTEKCGPASAPHAGFVRIGAISIVAASKPGSVIVAAWLASVAQRAAASRSSSYVSERKMPLFAVTSRSFCSPGAAAASALAAPAALMTRAGGLAQIAPVVRRRRASLLVGPLATPPARIWFP